MVEAEVSGTQLKVTGTIIDSIIWISNPTYERGAQAMARHYQAEYRKIEMHGCERSFDRTLTMDRTTLQDPFRVIRGNALDWDLLIASPVGINARSFEMKFLQEQLLQANLTARRLATISQGNLALFPWFARVDDSTAAFYGAHALYIIRPVQDASNMYHFAGECYIDEMMDGQVMTLAAEHGIQAKTITLV